MKEYKEKEKDPDLVPTEMIDQALSDFKKEQEDTWKSGKQALQRVGNKRKKPNKSLKSS